MPPLKLRDVVTLTAAASLIGEDALDQEVTHGCGADLLSDVLALVQDEGVLLLTGSVGPQLIRVAQILQLRAVLIVRGKRPSEEVCALARQACVPLFTTRLSMFEACGVLNAMGMKAAKMVPRAEAPPAP